MRECIGCGVDLGDILGVYCDDCITDLILEWEDFDRRHQGKSLEAIHLALWEDSVRKNERKA